MLKINSVQRMPIIVEIGQQLHKLQSYINKGAFLNHSVLSCIDTFCHFFDRSARTTLISVTAEC